MSRRRLLYLCAVALLLAAPLVVLAWPRPAPPTNADRYRAYLAEYEAFRRERLGAAATVEDLAGYERAHAELRLRHGLPARKSGTEEPDWDRLGKTPWHD
jgi:hypothetical protein